MKANEFVKKHGWNSLLIAKTLPKFNRYKYVIFYADEIDFSNEFHAGRKSYMFEVVEVKRLVESHELVAVHGFEKSKEIVANAPSDDHFYSWTLGGSSVRDKTVNIGELRKAIADVESCMEVSSESN